MSTYVYSCICQNGVHKDLIPERRKFERKIESCFPLKKIFDFTKLKYCGFYEHVHIYIYVSINGTIIFTTNINIVLYGIVICIIIRASGGDFCRSFRVLQP